MQQVVAVENYWRFRIEGWCHHDLSNEEHPYEFASVLAVPFLFFEAEADGQPFVTPIDVAHIADGYVAEGKDDVNGWTRCFPGGVNDALRYAARLDNCTQCARQDIGIINSDEGEVRLRLEHEHDCPDWLATLARRGAAAPARATAAPKPRPRPKKKRGQA